MRPYLFALVVLLIRAGSSNGEALPVLVVDDFEGELSRWQFADAPDATQTWRIISVPASNGNHALRTEGGSQYQPPHRSPFNVALLKDPVVASFDLRVKVQNTNYGAGGHRDLCILWGFQDPAHFYYVHLGAVPDPHSCQIFIVNGTDRLAITQKKSTGTPWDRGWHDVKVTRDTATGTMAVFFDDMDDPVMTATDDTFAWGRVGLGTFDDNGNFDDFRLRGIKVEPTPDAAKLIRN